MDERAADTFAESEGPIEAFLYGASVLHCLPVGMSEQPSAATGTVMRTDTMRRYAAEQPGSRTSRCCRSSTTCSASTASSEPAWEDVVVGTVAGFVGRRGARRDLQVLIERRSARGGLALVVGEAGIGKTSLVEVVTDGVPSLWARAREGWSAPPLWMWEQVLREARRRGWGDGLAAAADGTQSDAVGTGHERFRRFDELGRALLDLAAEHGCVIVLDDLQWVYCTYRPEHPVRWRAP